MGIVGTFAISFMLMHLNPVTYHYNHDSLLVTELQDTVDFTVLSPKNVPEDWTLDTKTTPAPWISLHFMDSQDKKMMVGIDEKKGSTLSDHDYPLAEKVDINGNVGYFTGWIDSGQRDKQGELITGGLLCWKQDGTFVEMNSSRLTKEEMLDIARSMK